MEGMELNPGDVALARLRIGILGLAAVVLALAASDIFDHRSWSFLLAAIIPTAAALATCTRSPVVRLAGAAAAIIIATGLVVAIADGSLRDVVDAFGSGAQRLVSTEWPSPARPDLLGTTALGLALATALSAELARHRRWHMLPVLPLLVTYIGIIATSSPRGVRLVWLVPLGLLLVMFAALRPGAGLGERATLLIGERRMVPLIVITAMIAGAVSLPLSLPARADPRRYDAPDRTAAILEPIEAMLAIRGIDPARELYRIDGDDADRVDRWRTAALDDYDGRRWAPAITIRPLGRTLGPALGDTVDVDVTFLDDDLAMFPLPGAPVTVDALIQTDLGRTVVRLDERGASTPTVRVRSNVAPDRSALVADAVGLREVDDSVSGLTDIAQALAGDGTIVQQLETIELRMRENFALDNDAPGGGLQRALIDRFLRETQRGNAEQFATAFVLLARSLGVDARVATGFVVDDPPSSGPLTLTSADVSVWPEVRVDDGWVAFDPVPTEEVSDLVPEPEEASAQTPAAPQPPIPPPPEADDEDSPEPATDEADSAAGLSDLAFWLRAAGLFVLVVVAPLLTVMLLILGAKRRRRRRRLSAPDPADRARGAWALATDALVDAGQTIDPSSTDREIATGAGAVVDDAQAELGRLAAISSAATYGSLDEPEARAEEAAACLGAVETRLLAAHGRLTRMRRRLSLRSLRSATRSPVVA